MARCEADRYNWLVWVYGLREQLVIERDSADIFEHGCGVDAAHELFEASTFLWSLNIGALQALAWQGRVVLSATAPLPQPPSSQS